MLTWNFVFTQHNVIAEQPSIRYLGCGCDAISLAGVSQTRGLFFDSWWILMYHTSIQVFWPALILEIKTQLTTKDSNRVSQGIETDRWMWLNLCVNIVGFLRLVHDSANILTIRLIVIEDWSLWQQLPIHSLHPSITITQANSCTLTNYIAIFS